MLDLGKLIMEARKASKMVDYAVYQEIKNEKMRFQTQKNAKPYTESEEIKLIVKILKQHQETYESAQLLGRPEIEEAESKFIEVVKSLLPKEPTEEELKETIAQYPKDINMGKMISEISDKYPTLPKSLLASLVARHLGK